MSEEVKVGTIITDNYDDYEVIAHNEWEIAIKCVVDNTDGGEMLGALYTIALDDVTEEGNTGISLYCYRKFETTDCRIVRYELHKSLSEIRDNEKLLKKMYDSIFNPEPSPCFKIK